MSTCPPAVILIRSGTASHPLRTRGVNAAVFDNLPPAPCSSHREGCHRKILSDLRSSRVVARLRNAGSFLVAVLVERRYDPQLLALR
jgi:hypothetical protein